MVIMIIRRDDWKNEFKIAWIVPICFFPAFGVLLHLFVRFDIGSISTKRKLLKASLTNYLDPPCPKPVDNGFVKYLYKNGFYPYYDQDIKYFDDGKPFFDSILEDIKLANHFIFLEYFIIQEGKMFDPILEILKEKAKNGVDVRIIYDGTTAAVRLPIHYNKTLNSYGIKTQVFAPIKPWISSHQNYRDHRKILVVDGLIAYTGGTNLADEYINERQPFGYWKDASARIVGKSVDFFTNSFLRMWHIYSKCEENIDLLFPNKEYIPNGDLCIPFEDNPHKKENISENIIFNLINNSKEKIYIMTPYFVIDRAIIESLISASKRGVDVRIVLPHIPDKKYCLNTARTYYKHLVQSGINFYEYTPGFIHSKVYLSDDQIAVVGSINLDFRSFYSSYECGILFSNKETIKNISQDFINTFEKSELITSKTKIKFFKRVSGLICKIFAPLL